MDTALRLSRFRLDTLGKSFPVLRRVLAECDEIAVYDIALHRRFRGIDRRDGVLIHGPAGWGEISPFWGYKVSEAARWFNAGLEAATEIFPVPLRREVAVNATIPVCDPEVAYQLVSDLAGVATAKVKVADKRVTLTQDCARLEAVRAALNARGGGTIRVDANAAWSVDEAVNAIKACDRAAAGLEYVEQPCASVAELAALRRRVDVPIAADESVRRSSDPLAVVEAEACDVIVTKVQPLGGIRATVTLAEAAALPVVVSSAIDTGIGLAMGAAAAAALPQLPYACGLATAALMCGEITSPSFLPVNGVVTPQRRNLVDTDFAAVSDELVTRWWRRLTAVAEYMEQQ